MYVGLDFGTTNSALCVARSDGDVQLTSFDTGGETHNTFRSILYCDPLNRDRDARPRIVAGPRAIEAYLAAENRGRLIQSLKSYLTSRLFTKTNIYGTSFLLEELIAIMVGALRGAAEAQFGELGARVVVGRPVCFSGVEHDDDNLFAEERLRKALGAAGFTEAVFEFEPVAAAYHYARRIDQEQLVLIADFGGGTSDFSLVRLGPERRSVGEREILGTAGVAIGGDSFDARIMRHLVSPALGRGTQYRGMNQKPHPVPVWVYGSLERWHHLSFLNNRQTLHMLDTIRSQALEKEKIDALIHVIEQNMGYGLYRSVEKAKHELSEDEASRFRFEEPPVAIECPLARASFEAWIQEDLQTIERCVTGLLGERRVAPSEVDRVFMTGGSSLVPSVRRIFETRFGAERMQGGGELTSVAEGLALRARTIFGPGTSSVA